MIPTRSVITSNTQTIPIKTSFGTLEITTSFIPGFSKSHEIDSITLMQSYALQSHLIQQCSVDSKERGQNRTATMNMDDGSKKQTINEGKGKKAMKWFGRKVKSEVENIRN